MQRQSIWSTLLAMYNLCTTINNNRLEYIKQLYVASYLFQWDFNAMADQWKDIRTLYTIIWCNSLVKHMSLNCTLSILSCMYVKLK